MRYWGWCEQCGIGFYFTARTRTGIRIKYARHLFGARHLTIMMGRR